MVVYSSCPDLLDGPNCTTSWREALEPASSIIEYAFIAWNVSLIVGSFLGLLAAFDLSFIKLLQLARSFCFHSAPRYLLSSVLPSTSHATDLESLNRTSIQKKGNKNVAKHLSLRKIRGQRQKVLVRLVFLGSLLQESCFVIFYATGMFLEFDFEDPRGLAAGYALTFALGIAFSTSFCAIALLRVIITSPLSKETPTMFQSLLDTKSLKDIGLFLLPNWCVWFIVWLLLGFTDVFTSPVILFRVFLGIIGFPLMFQAVSLWVTGNKLVNNLSDMLKYEEQQNTGNEMAKTTKMENIIQVRRKMRTYVHGMCSLLGQNAVMAWIIAFSKVMHEKTVFFVIVSLFGFSLVGFGTLVLYLFRKEKVKTKTSTNSNDKTAKALKLKQELDTEAVGDSTSEKLGMSSKLLLRPEPKTEFEQNSL